MFTLYLKEQGVNVALIAALDYMRTDRNGEPDLPYIKTHLTELLNQNCSADLFVTQGYICRNAYDEVDNLHRGGSDYSASLIGVAINAEEIEIWTDIDGMHNNDPRFVEGTTPVRHLLLRRQQSWPTLVQRFCIPHVYNLLSWGIYPYDCSILCVPRHPEHSYRIVPVEGASRLSPQKTILRP